jgi:hypothetical protein
MNKITGLMCRCLLVIHFSLFLIHSARAQTGTWLGLRIEYDEHVAAPLPVVLTLNADSSSRLTLIDANAPARRSTWSFSGGRMRLDTNIFAPNQWQVTSNLLRLNGVYPMVFRRLADPATVLDSTTVLASLAGHSWASDSLIYHLHANGSAGLENRRTGDLTQHCWQLARVANRLFLVLKGNRQSCDGSLLFPVQIIDSQHDLVQISQTDGYRTQTQTLRRAADLKSTDIVQPRGFQTCQPVVYAPFSMYPYFQYRQGRLHAIRQVVAREFRAVPVPGQSGLIRFRFVVNCEGQAGRFEVLEVDENYQKRPFNPQITSQLLAICRDKLTDWEPGQTTPDSPDAVQERVDTVCLLTFRLKDGQITEIFP